jgi:hypothetical protein
MLKATMAIWRRPGVSLTGGLEARGLLIAHP